MYWSDLNIFADLGFPKTAERIRKFLFKKMNSDDLHEWAYNEGYVISVSSHFILDSGVRTYQVHVPHTNITCEGSTLAEAVAKAVNETGFVFQWFHPAIEDMIDEEVKETKRKMEEEVAESIRKFQEEQIDKSNK